VRKRFRLVFFPLLFFGPSIKVGLLNFAFPVRKECTQALAVFFVSIFGSAPVRQRAVARFLLTFWSRGEEINSRAPNIFCLGFILPAF
jgi:hypothetical protein